MAHAENEDMDDFRVSMAVVVLLQAIVAMVYIIAIESDPLLSLNRSYRYVEPLLFLLPITTTILFQWRADVGRWFAVLAPILVLLVLQLFLPIPGSLALLAISTGLAAGLIGPRVAAVTAAGTVAGLLVLRLLTGSPDAWQIGIAFTAILTTLVLTVSVHRSVMTVAVWSRDYYRKALQIVQENRASQGELKQALDDLAHANRQMALLYERQTVLQHMAEEAERTKSAFVAKVSHEFRTPLNMIIGLAGVMIENPRMYGRTLPPLLLEDLRIIYRNCDHLASLVNDVLALSQLQSGGVVLRREELDLADTIEDAVDVVRPLLSQKKLSLTVEVPEELPIISGDRTRIRQIILNLLSNAARFTDSGGIHVRAAVQDRHVVVEVTDSGPGIAPGDLERIFEPFCQGSEHVWREKGGSGLGLTISKQFVELHGGRIWLDSTVGVGTTFFVALPVHEPLPITRLPSSWISNEWQWVERTDRGAMPRLPDRPRLVVYDPTHEIEGEMGGYAELAEVLSSQSLDELIREVQRTPAHAVILGAHRTEDLTPMLSVAARDLPDTLLLGWSMPPRIAPAVRAGADHYLVKPLSTASLRRALSALPHGAKRVMVVDDDEETRLLLVRMLAAHDPDLEVVAAAGGDEALQRLRCDDYDLLLLDLMMPQVDGLQVLEIVRSDPRLKLLPVIMISGQDLYETQPTCSELVMTLGKGLTVTKALECTLAVAQALLTPQVERSPVPQ